MKLVKEKKKLYPYLVAIKERKEKKESSDRREGCIATRLRLHFSSRFPPVWNRSGRKSSARTCSLSLVVVYYRASGNKERHFHDASFHVLAYLSKPAANSSDP